MTQDAAPESSAAVLPSTCTLYQGDCLEVLPTLAPDSVAMVFADLPYGATANAWDIVPHLPSLWAAFQCVLVERGWACFTSDFKLGALLYVSNPKLFRHDLIWHKSGRPSGFLHARHAPLRTHELISLFAKKQGTYNPQMIPGKPYEQNSISKRPGGDNFFAYKQVPRKNLGVRHPTSIQTFGRIHGTQCHPTQKPVPLLEWLISSYTNAGDTVLDPVMGSGTTGMACARLGRNFIGIEKDAEYFRTGRDRVDAERQKLSLAPSEVHQ